MKRFRWWGLLWLFCVVSPAFGEIPTETRILLVLEEEIRAGEVVDTRFFAFPAPVDLVTEECRFISAPRMSGEETIGYLRNLVTRQGTRRLTARSVREDDALRDASRLTRSGVVTGPVRDGAGSAFCFSPTPLPVEWERLERRRRFKEGMESLFSLFK